MTDIDLLSAHLRGEHSNERLSGCTACEGLPPISKEEPVPARVNPVPRPGPIPGSCWCGCGAEVSPNRRFRPGHDAKLKSKLVFAARGGDVHARAELETLGWTRFI